MATSKLSRRDARIRKQSVFCVSTSCSTPLVAGGNRHHQLLLHWHYTGLPEWLCGCGLLSCPRVPGQ